MLQVSRRPGSHRWITSILLLLLLGMIAATAWTLKVASNARRVVAAAKGPPLIDALVDFSKPFTNHFSFSHTVQPWYGTIYLTLRPAPWPANWTSENSADDDLKTIGGRMLLFTANGQFVAERPLDWSYGRFARDEPRTAPLQPFFTGFPFGRYALRVVTTNGLIGLAGTTQRLIVKYDTIHEGPIAQAFTLISTILALLTLALFAFLLLKFRRSRTGP